MHNGLTNEITFTHKEKKFILHPLLPSQVVEDHVHMKKKRGRKNNKNRKPRKSPWGEKGVGEECSLPQGHSTRRNN